MYFESFMGVDGRHYWRLRNEDGSAIADSGGGYPSKPARDRGIEIIQRYVGKAPVRNLDNEDVMGRRQDIYQFLVDHINIDEHPSYPDWPPVKQVLYVVNQIAHATYRAYEILETTDPGDDQELTRSLVSLWDTYFVPIDLPVNNFIERMVDNYGRGLLGDLVSQLATLVHENAYQQTDSGGK